MNTIITIFTSAGILTLVLGILFKWIAEKYLKPIIDKSEKNKKTATDIAVIVSRIVNTSHMYLTMTNIDEIVADILKQVIDELGIKEEIASREILYQIEKLGGEDEIDKKLKEVAKTQLLHKTMKLK